MHVGDAWSSPRRRTDESDEDWLDRIVVLPRDPCGLMLSFPRVSCFGVIWIRISDPRSVWIMVHQRDR